MSKWLKQTLGDVGLINSIIDPFEDPLFVLAKHFPFPVKLAVLKFYRKEQVMFGFMEKSRVHFEVFTSPVLQLQQVLTES